jgi:hypothetical protein
VAQNASQKVEDKFFLALSQGDAAALGKLLSEFRFSGLVRAKAWSDACGKPGKLDCIKALLPFVNPKRENSIALQLCAGMGDLEATRFLLPLCIATVNQSQALRRACENGHLEVVNELLDLACLDDQVLAFSDTVKRWDIRFENIRPLEPVLLHLLSHIGVDRLAAWHLEHPGRDIDLTHYNAFLSAMLDKGQLGMGDLAPLFQHTDLGSKFPSLQVGWDAYVLKTHTMEASSPGQFRRL